MKQYIIEVEETKAETVANLLIATNVKIVKPTEKKKYYVKIEDVYNGDSFLCLTEEQFNLLSWLEDNDYCTNWEEVNPTKMFEEIK